MQKKPVLLVACYFTLCFLHAQDVNQSFLDSLSGNFISQIRSQSRPKALLVTDKSIFKPGETIWFRAFVVNSASQKLTAKSKYLFVDLVDEQDKVISSVLLDAAHQQLNSKITLPVSAATGYYWLRAYTRQMAEGDTASAFIEPIYVVGAKTRPVASSIPKTTLANNEPTTEFYPEGGTIITQVNSTVAFLIKDGQGKPIAADGYVKDSRDSIVARFTSNKEGLGKFDLSSSFYRKYKAYVNLNGKLTGYSLPSFNAYAGQISVVKQTNGNKVIRVLLEDSIYKKDVVSYVVGVSRDSLCFAAIGHGLYEVALPEEKFPAGIATLYLFDSKGKLLSERSIYIKEHDAIMKAAVDKTACAKRDKVNLNIAAVDATHHPVASLLTVSVADSVFTNPNTRDEGFIYNNPKQIDNYALARLNNLTDDDIDLLMLFKNGTYSEKMSSNVFSNKPDTYDSLLFIRGKALDEKNNGASNKILTLIENSGSLFLTDTTNANGEFRFPVYDYADSTQFAIQAKSFSNKTENVTIVRDPIVFPKFSTPISLKHYFATEPVLSNRYRNAYLDTTNDYRVKQVNEVLVTTNKRKGTYNEALRVSSASTIIAGDDLDERRSTGDIVLTVGGLHMVEGVLVINGLTSMGKPTAQSEPLLLIDGVPAPQAGAPGESPVLGTLNSINPKEIDFIEILKGADGSNYGMRGGNGVILVNMAHSSRRNFVSKSGSVQTFYAKGISAPGLFPLINYDDKAIKASDAYDNRSTIYWNGSVITGSADNLNLSFFTADVPATYKVTITGVTLHGDFIYKTLSFRNR
jgi:hypothetical protein